MNFADRVIKFNRELTYTGNPLPKNIRMMNPFREHENVMGIMEAFYYKYYNDNNQRHIILGINPGRFGAGLTGIPFTDPKRLISECHIPYTGKISHEPSSVFVYEMINAYGGPESFYHKYYNDNNQRHIILGINPGRFGAGLTGIPFTDPKRLISECHIPYTGKISHEPSSVFVYEMINAYGGPESFYQDVYINSPCPLGFTSIDTKGKETNYNYYDSRELTEAVLPFMIENIRKQIEIGIKTDTCFCFGTGKNEKFLKKLNDQYQFFGKIIGLEHPRFIMQYKSASKQFYIDKYLKAFRSALE